MTALIVAAGSGERAPGTDGPKQYRLLGGKPVLRWAVEAFAAHNAIDEIRVVIRSQDQTRYARALAGFDIGPPIVGGQRRQDTVRNGLEALAPQTPDCVLIHDAARPFLSAALIDRLVAALGRVEAVAPVLRVTDTLRRERDDCYDLVDRDKLVRAQTPQGFRFEAIRAAHRKFETMNATDDLAIANAAGLTFAAVAGEEMNLKLTTSEDFALAERIASGALGDVRTGTGYDVHRFTKGDHLWLCGIQLAHEMGLEGHSDADVGLHALTDAVLGALSGGDIGQHFPPTDPRWRGAPSHLFLEHAASLLRQIGGVIAHVDITLICERPKISPYREKMRARIAEILSIAVERVSVKATTTEGLGFTGRNEGIAAQAVATIRMPL